MTPEQIDSKAKESADFSAITGELRYIHRKVDDIVARLADQHRMLREILESTEGVDDAGDDDDGWFDLYDMDKT